jgi:hypothetical protein
MHFVQRWKENYWQSCRLDCMITMPGAMLQWSTADFCTCLTCN